MEDVLFQKVLEVLIEVLLPVVLGFLVVWLKRQIDLVKARIPAEQLAFVSDLAYQLVLAAEQSGLAGHIENEAKAKKEWVLSQLEVELEKKGIHLDLAVLSNLIESAVYAAFKQV